MTVERPRFCKEKEGVSTGTAIEFFLKHSQWRIGVTLLRIHEK